MKRYLVIVLAFLCGFSGVAHCERIKDIVDIQGMRGNPLSGEGLIVGLAGTGDSGLLARQLLANYLRRTGIVIPPSDLSSGNIAVVTVTADLGPFAREGSRIDVDVSSIGDAKSLQGGKLVPTQLIGLDGQVYAIAEGSVSLGGWTASGGKASVTKNHQTVGRIPNGATVEKEELASFVQHVGGQRFITFNLRNGDFTTANRIGYAINKIYPRKAIVFDPGTVRVMLPEEVAEPGFILGDEVPANQKDLAGFIVEISQLDVQVDVPAVVVINERTGTIVVGENVSISAVAISQGSLVVKVKETPIVSQPMAPFSEAGETKVIEDTTIDVEESEGFLIPVSRSVTVSDLAKTLNAIGATPRDLIAIFNALKQAGALQAKLVIM